MPLDPANGRKLVLVLSSTSFVWSPSRSPLSPLSLLLFNARQRYCCYRQTIVVSNAHLFDYFYFSVIAAFTKRCLTSVTKEKKKNKTCAYAPRITFCLIQVQECADKSIFCCTLAFYNCLMKILND